MANVLVLLAHPKLDSLNGAAAQQFVDQAREHGHKVKFKKLYELGFDPILGSKDFEAWGNGSVPDDVAAEQKDWEWADKLAFFYPIWWNERPAIFKGYCDRILTKPWAWDFDANGLVSKLSNKEGFLAVTYGSPDALYNHLGIDQDHIISNMREGTMGYTGIQKSEVVETYGVLAERDAPQKHLDAVREAGARFLG